MVNGRTDQWWQNMLGADVPDSSWKKNFRMGRQAFLNLAAELEPFIAPKTNTPNHRFLSTEKKLAVTLYYLKDTGSLWMTANTFGIHQCTVTKTIAEVCHTISNELGPRYIYLPKNDEEMRKKVSEFELKFGMIQAFGCIDGTHVRIKSPQSNAQDYFNYKQFYSLNIQAVCDSKGLFMDVDCRWPGSVHDAKVFASSAINSKLQHGELPQTFFTALPGYEAIPTYLIADPAYPLTPFCMKEYQTCTENKQVIFNNMLRSARNQVECAFGRLKARWGFMNRKVDLKFEIVPKVAYSCFVLHNYCEARKNCGIDDEDVQAQMMKHREDEEHYLNTPDPIYSCNNEEGEYVRTVLTEYIKQHLPGNY